MTLMSVLDDTRRHPELAERIDAILRTVAPLVAETTLLSLPPVVRFRLLTPAAWRHEMKEVRRRCLAQDIADLDLEPQTVSAVRVALKISGFVPHLVWPLVLGATQRAADGRHETVVVPRALRHAGLWADERALVQMVSHELVHQLQEAATGGDNAWHSLFPQERGTHDRALSVFVEGHATWADREVTARMYGEAADHRQAPKSLRYRIHDNRVVRRLGPNRAAYDQGALLISHAVTAHGVDRVNQAWKDLSLLPTRAEVARPEDWTARIAV